MPRNMRGPHGRKKLNRYNPNAPDWDAVHRPPIVTLPPLPRLPSIADFLSSISRRILGR